MRILLRHRRRRTYTRTYRLGLRSEAVALHRPAPSIRRSPWPSRTSAYLAPAAFLSGLRRGLKQRCAAQPELDPELEHTEAEQHDAAGLQRVHPPGAPKLDQATRRRIGSTRATGRQTPEGVAQAPQP